jgi:hypothetical protein
MAWFVWYSIFDQRLTLALFSQKWQFFNKKREKSENEKSKCFPLMESKYTLIYAYQRGGSTEAALHDLVQKIEGQLESKGVGSGRVSGYRWSIW